MRGYETVEIERCDHYACHQGNGCDACCSRPQNGMSGVPKWKYINYFLLKTKNIKYKICLPKIVPNKSSSKNLKSKICLPKIVPNESSSSFNANFTYIHTLTVNLPWMHTLLTFMHTLSLSLWCILISHSHCHSLCPTNYTPLRFTHTFSVSHRF